MGYEATSGRYAAFFLGQLGDMRKQPVEAKKILSIGGSICRKRGATDSGYYLYSLISLGEIAAKRETRQRRQNTSRK